MKEKLRRIITYYGIKKQLKYFQSEVFELNEAIIKYDNDRIEKIAANITRLGNPRYMPFGIRNIADEIADVFVMLEQFRIYYGIPSEKIKEIVDYKIDRQLKRIELEEKEEKEYETMD